MTHRTVTNVLGKSIAATSPIAIPNNANPTTRFIFINPSLYNVSYSILCFTQTKHYR